MMLIAPTARAQSVADQPTPQSNYNIDGNGVDVVTGKYYFQTTDVSIGGAGVGLSYSRFTRNVGYDDDYSTALSVSGSTATVVIGAMRDTLSTTTGASQRGTGATISYAAGTSTYTTSGGVLYTFSNANASQKYRVAAQRVSTIAYPDGRKTTLTYDTATVRIRIKFDIYVDRTVTRVATVASNDGYRLTLSYALSEFEPDPDGEVSDQDGADWMTVTKVVASNDATKVCTRTTCGPGTADDAWPNIRYAWNMSGGTTETRTDGEGRQLAVTYDAANGRITQVQRASGPLVTLTYTPAGLVYQYTLGSGAGARTWTYAYSDTSTERTTTVTSPGGLVRTVVSYITTQRIKTDKVGTGGAMTFTYDPASTLPLTVTAPENNKVTYVYDGRGNVTSTTLTPKSGGGSIVTSATYAASCTAGTASYCNKPVTTTDARGKVTNYEYYSFGAVKSVTLPPPSSGAARPQTRYDYSQLYAWYKNSGGTIVQAATPIQRLASTSTCATGIGVDATHPTASCAGSNQETRTEIGYGTGSSSQAINLLPLTVTARSGNASGTGAVTATTTSTYDDVGNVIKVDGPVTAQSDITYARYNKVRELTDTATALPGGVGPTGNTLKRRSVRVTRNATTGLVDKVDVGTVDAAPTPTIWPTFTSLQRVETSYDAATFLPIETRGYGTGSTVLSLTQYSYDLDLRAKCTASRVGLATASDVCVQGSNATGYDQVAETFYGTDGRVQKSRQNSVDTATYTYTSNGQVQAIKDANNNTTTYGYDGYDRRTTTTYPTVGGATPVESVSYDAVGNVLVETRRSGATVTNVWDDLNRLYTRTPSVSANSATITNSYDNFGRLLSATGTGSGNWANSLSYSYDALSRLLTQTSNTAGAGNHVLTTAYDAGGRRTRLTWGSAGQWGGGFYVDYAYLATGEVAAIRENGATTGIGVLASYTYDDLGRTRRLLRGNGVKTEWTPDGLSRLVTLADDVAGTIRDRSVSLTYNGV